MLETLSENEKAIVNLLRTAKSHSKISIMKKSSKDSVEYRVEIQESILLTKSSKTIDGLL